VVVDVERVGLCGAYNWLDAKAAYEIDPNGANQPVLKGEVIDAIKGRWKGVDEFVYTNSHQALEYFNAYSIMDAPMTSCGCFECIMAIVPEANGVMIVNRGYTGMTPIGMKFSTLAGTVGGGRGPARDLRPAHPRRRVGLARHRARDSAAGRDLSRPRARGRGGCGGSGGRT